VRRLQHVSGGWRVGWDGTAPEEGDSAFHEAVLLTAPAYELARIEVASDPVVDLKFLEEIYYSPVSSLVLGFRREDVAHPLNGFGMLIPKVEPFKILGTLFSSSLFPGRAPDGHVTLTNYIGGVRAPELASVDREELIEMTCRDLSVLLGLKGKPVFVHHAYCPRAIPQYDVGYGRFQSRMDEMERSCPGLYFGGNYRGGVSLSDSILSGINLAERIKNDLNPRPTEPVSQA
jgi:oxygen-dependent protoporphyrinogen oxidase